jgi:FkbM family methyltransferase
MKSFVVRLVKPLAPIVLRMLGPKRFRRLRDMVFRTHQYDEVYAVYRAIAELRAGAGYLIDVGAHTGESFEPFAECGWSVDCFEPNPANHPAIQARIERSGGAVALYPVAVSNEPKENLTFYLSEQSTGISSLHAFHESHREGFKVDAIALRDHLAAKGNPHVDFLKIDTEGYDFFVLQGIDWGLVFPEIIICEFEDSKTEALGYNYKDMAQYLLDRGYEVIVSEWYPIEAYGKTHSWNRYTRFPSELESADAWGNLVAMQPGAAAEAVKAKLLETGEIVE